MRSFEFCSKAVSEGGKAKTNAWEGLWDAIITRPICGFLLDQLDVVSAAQTCSQATDSFAYAVEHECANCFVGSGIGECPSSGLE